MQINFTKYKYKGAITTFIIGIISVLLSLINLYYISILSSPKSNYNYGKIYLNPEDNTFPTMVAVQVYDIIDLDYTVQENSKEYHYYIIKHDYGYSFLETKAEDKEILKTLHSNKDLSLNPKLYNVEVVYAPNQLFLDTVEEINSHFAMEGLHIQVNDNNYISLANAQEVYFKNFMLICICFIIGFGFITHALFIIKNNKKVLSILSGHYPELMEEPETSIMRYGFYDSKLKLLLYKNHLISFMKYIQTVNLYEVRSYNTFIKNLYYAFIPIKKNFFINFILLNQKNKKLPVGSVGKETDTRLAIFYDHMQVFFAKLSASSHHS